MEFEELRGERLALNNAVLQHFASLSRFRANDWAWFKVTKDEVLKPRQKGTVRHLSTSASCIESLHDIPEHLRTEEQKAELIELTNKFAERALKRTGWESDDAAWVYSRVRTLPIILDFASAEALDGHAEAIGEHAEYAWRRLDPEKPSAQGVAERARNDGTTKKRKKVGDDPQQYPPNAFHTYWALRLLASYRRRQAELGLPDISQLVPDITLKKAVALLWCNRTLGAQTALLEAKASRVDAHQLAWALLADYEDSLSAEDAAGPTRSVTERRELYEAGLAAFFGAQNQQTGAWPRYEPLFHYPGAGNAYCYSFETLAELIRPALQPDGYLLRELLLDYFPQLASARKYISRTALRLGDGAVGWCSGHHPHRSEAEGWATASVFSFMQGLRRLVGIWTAEAARNELGARKTKFANADQAANEIRERGLTWTSEEQPFTVGQQLAGMFINPMQVATAEWPINDPDAPLVGKEDARSAILYGPPGTGKTTLVEGLAGTLGWDFIEISAAAFVERGIDQVPARADEIFTQLMEIDRAVVLFDEVDELIRKRVGDDTEAFGRFLTTSMLPKLTKLWDQRRVLFFVATNSITEADPAIRRSQRFDASIFVAPPSFRKKFDYLADKLKTDPPKELKYDDVQKALADGTGSAVDALGAFALLRWDQIPELAQRVLASGVVSYQHLEQVLEELRQELTRVEYQSPKKDSTAFTVWNEFLDDLRRDPSRRFLARIDGVRAPKGAILANVGEPDAAVFLDINTLASKDLQHDYTEDVCRLKLGKKSLRDRGLLRFGKDE